MKRICITGAGGMIGRALTKYALSRGTAVTALVRPGSGKLRDMTHPLLQVIEADLSSLDAVQCPPCDVFVHLGWAATHGDTRLQADIQSKNVDYTLSAVRLAHRLGAEAFVFVGSQAEYGPQTQPLRPDTPTQPVSAYGIAKREAGEKSRTLCASLGIRYCHVRILSVYGVGDRSTTLVSVCVDAMLRGTSPALTTCTQMWDYLYVDDAARALYAVSEKGRDGAVYPLGSGECRPLRDYVLDIRDVTGCNALPRFGEKDFLPDQVHYLCADLTALTADTGFVPQVPFREGIRRICTDKEATHK